MDVVTQLPTDIAPEVIDLIDPTPTEFPQDQLKATILRPTTFHDETKPQQLVVSAELGDRPPSQLLGYMRPLDSELCQ